MNAELMNGRMALHWAADYGQVEIIEYLLSQGAEVNVSVVECWLVRGNECVGWVLVRVSRMSNTVGCVQRVYTILQLAP